MSSVSVREFSYHPTGVFSRVERGETIQVTRHDKVVAVLLPGSGTFGRYTPLVTKGIVKLKAITTSDLHRIPHFPVPDDVSPVDVLLAERAEDDR